MVQIPWSTLSEVRAEVERVASEYLGKVGPGKLPIWDLVERPQEFILLAEMPGVLPESIDVRLAGSTLTIKGEKRQEPPEPGEVYYIAERSYGLFSRSVLVPAGVDSAGVKADYKQGVLRVRLPKSPEPEAHKIQVEQIS